MMKFRKDINGLRALAVIGVVLFHFKLSIVPGGFAGVDVFFVISGFLMTSIIYSKLSSNSFSLIDFYLARAKRIIPALALLCLCLLLIGWLSFTPIELTVLGKHTAAALTFISNFVFWKEAGYFDAASHQKLLLHTWSLSVEWQFYLIYPIALVAIKTLLPIEKLKIALILATLASYFLSVFATQHWPSPAYYLLPTRAWELTLGGLAFFYQHKITAKWQKPSLYLGFALILYSYLGLSPTNAWPGHLALLPALGAYLVISAQSQTNWLNENPLMQKIGLWSYSIYLWHWPIVVLQAKYELGDTWLVLGIIGSVMMGAASYYTIEIRSNALIEKLGYTSLSITFATIVFLSVLLMQTHGFFEQRYAPQTAKQINLVLQASQDWAYPKANSNYQGSPIRVINNPNHTGRYLFIGDSLMEQYYPAIVQKVQQGKMPSAYFFTESGCMPLKGMERPGRKCKHLYRAQQLIQEQQFDKIFVTGQWNYYLSKSSPYFVHNEQLSFNNPLHQSIVMNKMKQFLKSLSQQQAKVIFILPNPQGKEFSAQKMMQNIINNNNTTSLPASIFVERFSTLKQQLEEITLSMGITLIDPIDDLCPQKQCPITINQGHPTHKDEVHLSTWYVKNHVNYFNNYEL